MNRISKEHVSLFEIMVQEIKKEYEASGIAITIIDKKGNTQYEYFTGYRDEEKELPIDQDTILGLASVTKSFTCLAIMQMEQAGILKITDPVKNYIPEFTNKNQEEVQIWHLMCHSGGFYPLPRIVVDQVAKSLGLNEGEGDLAYNDQLAVEGIKLVAQRLDEQTKENGLNGKPGQYLSYGNEGFGLLSDIIRRYGGEASYAEYLNKCVLAPLGMKRSGCDFIKPSIDTNSSILYKKVGGEKIGHHDYQDNAFVLNGGGAMKSTLDDMTRYVTMYLNEGISQDGKELLNEDGIREMCKPRQLYRPQVYYGYGLSTKHLDDITIVEHGGSLPGVSSNIAWSYEAEVGVIVLCNTSGVPVSLISDAAMKMYNGTNPLNKRDTYTYTPWTEETIAQACGKYFSGEGSEVELYKKEDQSIGLRIDGKEQNIIPVQPQLAIIRNKMTDGILRLFKKNQQVFAIGYGGRMIKKMN